MSSHIEGLESRTLFSISPVVAADIRALHAAGTALRVDLVDSHKAATADYNALVLTLKANGVFKEDRSLLTTLSRQGARYRTPLTVQTNQMLASLNSRTTALVNAIYTLDRHTQSKAYAVFAARYSAAYSRYLAVEDSIDTTLDDDRDALGSVDMANLTAIANANPGKTSVQDEVDSIIASSTTGETDFANRVSNVSSAATTVLSNFF